MDKTRTINGRKTRFKSASAQKNKVNTAQRSSKPQRQNVLQEEELNVADTIIMSVDGLGTIEVARSAWSEKTRVPRKCEVAIYQKAIGNPKADFVATAQANESVVYECEYNCGFKGSFELVERHELRCKRNGSRNSSVVNEKEQRLQKEIERLITENERLRNLVRASPFQAEHGNESSNSARFAKRQAKFHSRRMSRYRHIFSATQNALKMVDERLRAIGIQPMELSQHQNRRAQSPENLASNALLPSVSTTLSCNSIPNESKARDGVQPNGKSLSIRKVICDSLSELQHQKGGGLDAPIDIDNLRVAVNQSLTNKGLQDFAALHFPGKSSLCHFRTGLLICISNFDLKSRTLVVFCKLNSYSFVNIADNKSTKNRFIRK